MNIKKIIICIGIILSFYTGLLLYFFRDQKESFLDVTMVNDITESLANQWDNINSANLPCLNYGLDYVVLNSRNQLIASTKNNLSKDLNSAIRNRDTIVDIKKNNEVIGKLIIYNKIEDIWKQRKKAALTLAELIIISAAAICIICALNINKSIFDPFHKMKRFARNIAEGNLDIPLEMDKGNRFGAFTESFDLMRDEIRRARENERVANKSKKELVASLSHDIKTPVASIKAVSEIIAAKSDDSYLLSQLDIIGSKADQINTLITNMFTATLEELQELKVSVSEQSSQLIYDMIKKADYNKKVKTIQISECIIYADLLRLAQVIDNVISNSYKYADTFIEVKSRFRDKFLEIDFKDFGAGIYRDELPLIFNKFYRAANSEGKSGTGLGLYISKFLLNNMNGDIECENVVDGFIMRLKLRIP